MIKIQFIEYSLLIRSDNDKSKIQQIFEFYPHFKLQHLCFKNQNRHEYYIINRK